MGTTEKAAAKRLGRGIFSLIISGVTSYLTGNPAFLVAVPVINALGKWLRGRFNLTHIPF